MVSGDGELVGELFDDAGVLAPSAVGVGLFEVGWGALGTLVSRLRR